MRYENIISRYEHFTYSAFRWRYELSVVNKIALSLVFAVITGISAQIRFYLPFTPVPVTGQVFAVLLGAVMLGRIYGGVSQLFYVGLGAMGVPWFSGLKGGISVLSGVTGGYLIGFVVSSFVIGWLCERYIFTRKFLPQMIIMSLGILIIYFFGALHFSILLNKSFEDTIKLAVLPFIPLDLLKAIFVSTITSLILPKRAYNGEVDR